MYLLSYFEVKRHIKKMPHMNLIKRHQTSLERKANPNNSFSIEKGTRGLFKEAREYCEELEFESSQL